MKTYDSVINLDTVAPDLITELYTNGSISSDSIKDQLDQPYPHDKLYLSNPATQSTALAIVNSDTTKVELVVNKKPIFGIKSRNREQAFLLKLLQDNNIKLQVVLGKAGTGKTMCVCASALHQLLERKAYKKIVFTKPTYLVGQGIGIGTVPGSIREKMEPFLINFQHIVGELALDNGYQSVLEGRQVIEYVPIQLMRGASFRDTLIILDEAQSLNMHEMKTLCTRIGHGSKLVILGDLSQRDRQIKVEDTGLHRLVTSEEIKKSSLCSVIELVKNERSELSELLDNVLTI